MIIKQIDSQTILQGMKNHVQKMKKLFKKKEKDMFEKVKEVIEEKLKSFLAPKDRTISEEGAGGDE